jgi:hypothetical protein
VLKLRLFEALVIVSLGFAGFGVSRAIWSAPGETMKDVPKNVRSNHASYRSHYRHYVFIGGK